MLEFEVKAGRSKLRSCEPWMTEAGQLWRAVETCGAGGGESSIEWTVSEEGSLRAQLGLA